MYNKKKEKFHSKIFRAENLVCVETHSQIDTFSDADQEYILYSVESVYFSSLQMSE